MSSHSENGNKKNLANFEKLVAEVVSYGAVYNPSKESITLASLNNILSNTRTSMSGVINANASEKTARFERKNAFGLLTPLVRRVKNAALASDTTDLFNNSVKSTLRLMEGKRVTPKMTDEEKKAATESGTLVVEHSSSQTGIDFQLEHLESLVSLLKATPAYAPNEVDLKAESIEAFHLNLTSKNSAVLNAEVATENAVLLRDEVMYTAKTGLVDTAGDIKAYVKSVYGASSPQYKLISRLNFVNYKK